MANYIKFGDIFKKTSQELLVFFIPSMANGYKPRFLESKLLGFIIFTILVARITLVLLFVPLPQNVFFADVTKIDLLNLLNQNRQDVGLPTLVESSSLNRVAMLKANDMIKNGYFAHTSPAGKDPWFWFKEANYKYQYAGENLAVGFVESGDVYSTWMSSPSHKANLLNPRYQEVGMAVVTGFGENNATLVVQVFAKPLDLQNNESSSTIINNQDNAEVSNTSEGVQENIIEEFINNNEDAIVNQNEENTIINNVNDEKVLSQTSVYYAPTSEGNFRNDFYSKFLNFIIYNGESVLNYANYTILIAVCLSLSLSVMSVMKNKGMVSQKLVARSLMVAMILLAAIFLRVDTLMRVIPNNITI